jgi:hypothetical protein
MAISEKLGMPKYISNMWEKMLSSWEFRGKDFKGKWHYNRQTGSSDTSYGNVLTSFQVLESVIRRNNSILIGGLFLGDDSLLFFSDKPELDNF